MNGDSYSDMLIGAPYANGVSGESYLVYGSKLASSSSSSSSQTMSSEELSAIFSASSFVVSAVASYVLRKKISFYVLNNWGHHYKFIYKGNEEVLKKNEIGLRLNNESLVCVIKNKEYDLPIDDNQ